MKTSRYNVQIACVNVKTACYNGKLFTSLQSRFSCVWPDSGTLAYKHYHCLESVTLGRTQPVSVGVFRVASMWPKAETPHPHPFPPQTRHASAERESSGQRDTLTYLTTTMQEIAHGCLHLVSSIITHLYRK